MNATRDNGHSPHSSLRHKLFQSHLAVALFGFGILVAALLFSMWLAKYSKQLATAADPSRRIELQQIHDALETSSALVFRYIAMPETQYRHRWWTNWETSVWPALAKLEQQNPLNGAYQADLLANLKALLAQLEMRQWQILEVRDGPGNYPAQAVVHNHVQDIEDRIDRGLTTLVDLAIAESQDVVTAASTKRLSDLRASFIRSAASLHRFVSEASPAVASTMQKQHELCVSYINALINASDLSAAQLDLLTWLKREFRLYVRYSDEAVAARNSEQWNIAQYLMVTEVNPLTEAADDLINEMLRHNSARITQSRATVFSLSELNFSLSIVFLFAMLLAAWFSARYRANRIVTPIENLVAATRKLAQEQRLVPLPVRGDDELAALTESFNEMQRSLLHKQAQLHQLATTDPLTSLANRRTFTETMAREWKRCLRDRKKLAVIMIDVDYFKQFNDQFGHQAGDHALCAIADVLREQLHRPGDLAARYGGEEFIIVLPTDTRGAGKIAEQIAQGVDKLRISAAAVSATRYLSVSIGLAVCLPDHDLEWEGLIKTADQALYRAKSQGRHRTCESTYGVDGMAESSCDSLRLS
ncbi:hypothetical protein Tel_01090 [Candidatus Tenderia electrophaga]|jgi:diguanylate cyclase (GGDEF)-like protein|uniref:diguanylate cyclase n=1 Tax=Candidatus Tenderia electrophaga TaxID=1748243 RepID=A0A0S2T9N7_9GAMM|nr:hypothetical protein Tel_01090 [Candidatus Tenderia electrophaga]